ncbi:MAG: hypothetical protein JWQ39_2032 [Glaciihabitans sp.]|nr:hypothetical protein [Glaciihabitans sp.]
MPLNRDFIGRSHTASDIYEVSREKIREYAMAMGDPDPAYLDPAHPGGRDVVAPPTFAAMLFARLGSWPLTDPGLGKNKAPFIVQGEQRVVHHRTIRPGDRLTLTSVVRDIRDVGCHELLAVTHEITTVTGEPVCTIDDVGISRGTAELGERSR